MKGEETSLYELLDSKKIRFRIPIYQRNYSWTKDNCERLFDDVRALIDNKGNHFLGSLVTKEEQNHTFSVIDGQQRITSVSLLIAAMIRSELERGCSPDSGDIEDLQALLFEKHCEEEENKIKLKPFGDDKEAYESIALCQSSDKTELQLVRNFNTFRRRIEETKMRGKDLLRVLDRLKVINIILGSDDDAQLIFECINSTGLDLTETDKVRNFVLMNLDEKRQTKLFKEYWLPIEKSVGDGMLDEFLRDFLTIKMTTIPKIDETYEQFKKYFRGDVKRLGDAVGDRAEATEGVLGEMRTYAVIFRQLTDEKHEGLPHECRETLCRLALLKTNVQRPFLMQVVKEWKEKRGYSAAWSDQTLSKIMRDVESNIARRTVVGLPTNALNRLYADLFNRVRRRQDEEEGEKPSFYDALACVMLSLRDKVRFPKDEELRQSFQNFELYKARKNVQTYFLSQFENHMNPKEAKSLGDYGKYQTEHIMPQKLSPEWRDELGPDCERVHDEWLNKIANLTLTGYNPELSNKSFIEKKRMSKGYSDSNFALTRDVANSYTRWNEDALKDRQSKLVGFAMEIWPAPQTDLKPVERVRKSGEKTSTLASIPADDRIQGSKPLKLSIRGQVTVVSDWARLFLQFLKEVYAEEPNVLKAYATNAYCFKEVSSGRWFDVAPDLRVNVNNDTKVKIKTMQELVENLQLSADDVLITYVPKDNLADEDFGNNDDDDDDE